MIKAGIIGATGYAGQELVRLLLQHKEVEIVWYGSRSYVDKKFSSVFGNVFQIVENICKSDDLHTLAKEADVIFTATPQGYLAGVLDDEILSQAKVIDLSADYRIKDVAVYEKWYGITPVSYTHLDVYKRQLFRGFDDIFDCPQSRAMTVNREDVEKIPELEVLAVSDAAGVAVIKTEDSRQFFMTGHLEYDSDTLAKERCV